VIDIRRVREFSRRVAEEFRPERIILFGSYAHGHPSADSDVDLLVILPFQGRGARKAIEILSRIEPGFPVDMLVRTPAQVRQRLTWGDCFMREIIEHGKVLYEAASARVG
jgi:predicted nucleotidyltransferase